VERVQTQEHTIYPLVVSWFVDGRLAMRDGAAWLDGERLPAQGHAAEEDQIGVFYCGRWSVRR
ncbi:hypothetical protein ISX56_27240, partial [Serratia ureilytica]|nr:hypothetical protein [Serratia ureilytica]